MELVDSDLRSGSRAVNVEADVICVNLGDLHSFKGQGISLSVGQKIFPHAPKEEGSELNIQARITETSKTKEKELSWSSTETKLIQFQYSPMGGVRGTKTGSDRDDVIQPDLNVERQSQLTAVREREVLIRNFLIRSWQ